MKLLDAEIALAAVQMGLGRDIEMAVAIALAESGGDPYAHNAVPPDDSYGLWQINMLGKLGEDRRLRFGLQKNEELYSPHVNADAMIRVSGNGTNWNPWTTFTRGTYQQFMERGMEAARKVREIVVASSTYYTEQSRQFMEALLALEPGTQNGGMYANKPGYHNTRNNLIAQGLTNDYSVRYDADKSGPGDKAAAYDWTFPDAQGGNYTTIRKYMTRIKQAFDARDSRLAGWREALGQQDADGDAEGFDFYFWSTRTPDSSHMWHIHLSEKRSLLGDWGNKERMLSVLRGEAAPVTPPPPAGSLPVHANGSREISNALNSLGTDVLFVQKFIGSRCGTPDGDFGPNTENGVRWYQQMRGIGVDGIVGRTTWRNMGVTPTY